MASQAKGLAKKTTARRMPGPVPSSDVPLKALSLRLTPMLQPHRPKGRLAVRIERVPQLARLSRGRNNGDGSWSLASDELDALEYLGPEGAELPVLAVRIIGLEQDGATLAVRELALAEHDDGSAEHDAADDAYLQRLGSELKAAQAALAEREAEIAELRRTVRVESEKPDALAAARAAWDSEMEKRLTDAAAGAAQSAERQARLWQAGEAERLAAVEAKWRDAAAGAAAEARALAEAQAAAALEQAERGWKAAEAERFAAAETRWRDNSAKAAREAAGRAQADHAKSGDAALQATRAQVTEAQKALNQREDELARARAALEAVQQRGQGDLAGSLARAEAEWKRGEGERLAAAEAQWRMKSSADLAALTARCETAERSLAQNTQAQTVRDAELNRLREERTSLQAALAESERARAAAAGAAARQQIEDALAAAKTAWKSEEAGRLALAETTWRAEARAANDAELIRMRDEAASLQARLTQAEHARADASGDGVRQQIEAVLANAKATWTSEEAARLAAAENQWRAKSAGDLAALTARCEAAERAVALDRTAQDAERNRLQEECAGLRAKLAEAERAPAAVSDDVLRQQIETALTGAKAAWKSEEAGRLALAGETWRAEANASLARATARAESAEAALSQARTAASHGQYDQAFIDGQRREIEALQRAIADREVELAQARMTLEFPAPDSRHARSPFADRTGTDAALGARTAGGQSVEPPPPARCRHRVRRRGRAFLRLSVRRALSAV